MNRLKVYEKTLIVFQELLRIDEYMCRQSDVDLWMYYANAFKYVKLMKERMAELEKVK